MGHFIFWCPSSDEKVPLIAVTPSEHTAFCHSPGRDRARTAEHLLISPSENHRSLIKWRFLHRDVPLIWGLRQPWPRSARAWRSQSSWNQMSLMVCTCGSPATDSALSFQLRFLRNHGINPTFGEIAKGGGHSRKRICRVPALPRHPFH